MVLRLAWSLYTIVCRGKDNTASFTILCQQASDCKLWGSFCMLTAGSQTISKVGANKNDNSGDRRHYSGNRPLISRVLEGCSASNPGVVNMSKSLHKKMQPHGTLKDSYTTYNYHSKRLDYEINSPRIFWCDAHEIFMKNNSPRICWCNDYVSRRRWGKRCKSDKLREIIRPEFFDVSQDEIITRNNCLKIKWWNVILEFPMVSLRLPAILIGFASRANSVLKSHMMSKHAASLETPWVWWQVDLWGTEAYWSIPGTTWHTVADIQDLCAAKTTHA